PQHQHFGVRRRINGADGLIECFGDNLAVDHEDGADRHLTRRCAELCLLQGGLHEGLVHDRGSRSSIRTIQPRKNLYAGFSYSAGQEYATSSRTARTAVRSSSAPSTPASTRPKSAP